MRTTVVLLTVTGLLATAMLAPAAQAKSPPKGTYECTIGFSNQLFGSIKIRAGGKYRYSRFGKTGTFKAGKTKRKFSGGRLSAYPISFKGGGLNRFKGYWFTSTTGTHEIALARPGSSYQNIYCDD